MAGVVALGAQTKTTFSILDDNGIFLSEEFKDLSDIRCFNRYERAIREYFSNNSIIPKKIVCDLHPDYLSTALAIQLAKEKNCSLIRVQHHFAHIISCMVDNNIDEHILGVCFDGTGFGDDGRLWGGEFLLCDKKDFKRLFHFKYISQSGGDIAAKEGWRMAVSYLADAYGENFDCINIPLIKRIGKEKIDILKHMIKKKINSPLTSSAGRLFDAVSSLTGVCDISGFEAEAAIKLEKKAIQGVAESYEYTIRENEICFLPMIKAIVDDLSKNIDIGIISAKFHNTLGEVIFDISKRTAEKFGICKVLISGGCFQNRYLREYVMKKFSDSNIELFAHKNYPVTDAGLSIGQAVIAETINDQ